MSGYDARTLAFYAADAPVYTASGKLGVSRHLDRFLDRLPAGADILELGCGGGRDAAHMTARGFTVDPTDGVAEIAAKAEAQLGRPVRVMRFGELDAAGRYDAIWASASLLHVPRCDLPDVVARVHRALRPGGLHFASYKGGGAEGRDRFGRYFNYLARAELESIYHEAAVWDLLDISEGVGGGYDGAQGPWVQITLRRPL
ncbi:SAM-dependent methyltransferase [Sphingopyxis sp. Root214]|uniref:class I SAM-dependent methyltransferase n=1 Tax=unclassified Sphingopyxis TaxID=2614943 RepID=UPI0006FF9C73|nr:MULTISPECIES: class I SAM-dependent methyltransferase [unclassified Sphingopyxis]KQZ69296.1 SAM-dependent methyltransferase [Sphingopyxis sp. Root154]KRC10697.1 SAM-dependent methyltransferase [Sphingopyxis sp. Root214]